MDSCSHAKLRARRKHDLVLVACTGCGETVLCKDRVRVISLGLESKPREDRNCAHVFVLIGRSGAKVNVVCSACNRTLARKDSVIFERAWMLEPTIDAAEQ